MAIAWQEELATGIEYIDAQHKGIFARFAAFSTACDTGCAKGELINLMDFLEDYTRNHFSDEEKSMQEAEYPDLYNQQKYHKMYLDEVAELKRKVGGKGPDMRALHARNRRIFIIAGGNHVLEKTMTMEEVRILDICRDIELLNEQLYRYFAGLFPENEEIATLWRKTANEEANHAQQFDLAIRIKKELLVSVSIDAWTVATAFKFVRTLLESVKKSPPSVADALQIGVMLEERLTNLHLECIAGFTEESHKMLFRAMMAQDNRHMESLLEAQKKYSEANPAKAPL